MNLLKKIKHIYHRYFTTPELYAKHCGVKIGKNNFIRTFEWGTEPYLISIGNNVQITNNVIFHTHGGGHVARKRYPQFDVFGKIHIKDWAYVGSGCHIMPGVTIGEGSLIAAGSIVTKSVPDGEVWGGVPARKISTVDEYIERNLKFNTNTKGLTQEKKKFILLELDDSKFIKK